MDSENKFPKNTKIVYAIGKNCNFVMALKSLVSYEVITGVQDIHLEISEHWLSSTIY